MTRLSSTSKQTGQRNARKGVVLLATLLTAFLLIGLVASIQAIGLQSVQTISRLSDQDQRDVHAEAARLLFQRQVATAMLGQMETPRLNGSPHILRFESEEFQLAAQDVDGLVDVYRTSDDEARSLLRNDLYDLKSRLTNSATQNRPLRQLAAKTGFLDVQSVERELTTQARSRSTRQANHSIHYNEEAVTSRAQDIYPRQVNSVLIWIIKN